MKRTNIILLGITLILFTQTMLSANDKLIRKNHIELSPLILKLEQDGSYYQNNMWGFKLNYSRNIKKYLSLGANLGLGRYREFLYSKPEINTKHFRYDQTMGWSMSYAATGKLHLLPLLFKKDISFVDLYLKGELGLITMNSSTYKVIIPARGTFFDFSGMGGCTLYLSKGFGLFAEAGYQQFIYYNGFHARYGLSFRF
jgi:hypothetical protein